MAPIEPSYVECPDGEACKNCPCSAEDDVCFPGERLRADLERERRARGLEQLDMARLEAEVERLREAHRAALNTAHAEVDRLRRALYEIVNITVASQMAAEALHG